MNWTVFWRRWQVLCVMAAILTGRSLTAAPPIGTATGWGANVQYAQFYSPIPITNGIAMSPDRFYVLTADGRVREDGNAPRPDLTNIVAVAPEVALRNDGVVLTWRSGSTNPATAIASNAMAIAADYQILVLESNGTVLAWGDDFYGQADVPAGLSNVIAIAAGQNSSLAVKMDGTVVAWGDDTFGECDVPAGLSNVIAVAAGSTHSLALRKDGTVVGWGAKGDDVGQADPPPSATNVVVIAAGLDHSLALRADGSVVAWGDNSWGELNLPDGTNYIAVAAEAETTWVLTRLPIIVSTTPDQTILAGTNVEFDVDVVGSYPWTYSWWYNGSNTIGSTASNLVLTNLQVSDSGSYSVIVSDTFGAVTSAPIQLIVQPFPAAVTMQPTNLALVAGGTAEFTVAATGAAPIYYQWYFEDLPMSGQTNSSLILEGINDLNVGLYMAEVSNVYGTNFSSQAVLTVNDPPTISNSLTSLSLPAGTNWILGAVVDGNQPISYQWQFQGTNIPGATNLTFVLPNVQLENGGQYALAASNAFGAVTNALYSITVQSSPPVIYQQPMSQNFAIGGNVALQALAYGSAPLTAQWSFEGAAIPGATNFSLLVYDMQQTNAGSYSVIISNSMGFATSSATLTVGQPFSGQVDLPTLAFVPVGTNTFRTPVCITHAGDGSGRQFIVELRGQIWILESNSIAPQSFLNITNRVFAGGSEQGLLGVAFSSGYSTNNRFYVDYTIKSNNSVVISRFHAMATNSSVADPNSEEVILTIPKPFNNHNAGQLSFGPDGYLYIGVGDGGSEGDPLNNGQTTTNLLGKILRIDVESGATPYAVPLDNLFVGNTNFAPEIWAYGLRNPWRFSFDRLTGDLYIGDVGQNSFEEVDFQPHDSAGGQNYGWRIMEGPSPYSVPRGVTNFSEFTPPVAGYSHFGAAAGIGGYVFRGPNEYRMAGMYFFGDFITGMVRGAQMIGTNWQTFVLSKTPYAITTFGEDDDGNLFAADYGSGKIFQVVDSLTVWAPTLSPGGGVFYDDEPVTMTSQTPGVVIHFTTDGRDPTEFDPAITNGGAVLVQSSMTLKARAFRPDLQPSTIAAGNFYFQTADPDFSPDTGPIANGTTLTITSTSPRSVVHYTLDGSIPNETSPIYTSPITINGGTTVSAFATVAGYAISSTVTVFYSLVQTETPILSTASGIVPYGTNVSIACPTPGATIYYTLDETTPTTNSILYISPISIQHDLILSAVAVADGHLDSLIQSAIYSLPQLPVPIFNQAPGLLTNGTEISITCQATNAVIYYTVDGMAPGTNSAIYSAPILLSGPIRLNAQAFAFGFDPSPVASAYYTSLNQQNTVVTTLAGQAIAGFTNGVGSAAQFSGPQGICIDNVGNLYVADTGNNVIRKITPTGLVTTFAGTGVQGTQLGQATNAQLWAPAGICRDTNGNFYVSEPVACNRILKIDTNENVTTLVEVTCPTCDPCRDFPIGLVAVDSGGNIFTGRDGLMNKISPQGSISSFSVGGSQSYGDGITLGPGVDFSTNLYVAQAAGIYNATLWKIGADGAGGELFAGSVSGFTDGSAASALFYAPQDVVVDSAGNAFVTDVVQVRRIDADKITSTLAGIGAHGYLNGRGNVAQFNYATGICVDAYTNVYVADTGNNCIRKISPDTSGIGIADDWQRAHFGRVGIDPNADPDGDGMSNYEEFWAGTDPLDPASVFMVNSLSIETNGVTQVTWQSVPGKSYNVKFSTDLETWSTLQSSILATSAVLSVTDPALATQTPQRFYRVFVNF